ncbi:LOW QUALITY PROTEIN: hypothetical protein Cgig2_010547 [Carnegiea gigantea]|uniref:Uncharacterized protein n=1 Tax=Carnegiea gigantea TaxID=171969 RepID=A0A9Q1KT92_9CARY|nr:LOW QUALITY PROTEIN: hypothetical protein Cgig2_010547 [Carnegiea gigantea]
MEDPRADNWARIMSDATSRMSFLRVTPVSPLESSSRMAEALSLKHRWSLITRTSVYLDSFRACFRLVSKIAAPPILNRQLRTSLGRSLPEYKPVVSISVLRIITLDSLWTNSKFWAKAMARMLALQPIPERLKVLTSDLISNLLTIMEEREGEEQKALQLTMRKSMSRGQWLDLTRRSSMMGKRTIWASWIEFKMAQSNLLVRDMEERKGFESASRELRRGYHVC